MIVFDVPGIPVPQGNHRMGWHGRSYDTGVGLDQWRKDVGTLGRIAWKSRPILTGAVSLAVVFKMPAPQYARRQTKLPPAIKRPDTSKLVRAIEDSLTGIVYADDSQIVHLEASKMLVARDSGAIVFVEWADSPHHHEALIAGSPCDLCGEHLVSSLHLVERTRAFAQTGGSHASG